MGRDVGVEAATADGVGHNEFPLGKRDGPLTGVISRRGSGEATVAISLADRQRVVWESRHCCWSGPIQRTEAHVKGWVSVTRQLQGTRLAPVTWDHL
jgi:hypothetical protein